MNKQELASHIWEAANKMRSKIEANEYKDYILGFIFYKFLSDKEVKYLKDNDWTDEYLPEVTEEDQGTVENVRKNLGYFISYENLFSTWLKKGSDFSADNVSVALSAFNRLINPSHKKVFGGIFATLDTGLSKLGESSGARTKAIRDLLNLIKDIPMDGKQGYDVLGFIYEYLIQNFAANAGKKAGEFYTPHEVSLLMSDIVANHLKDRKEIKIYDPTSGSGSLLINIGNSVSKVMDAQDNVKYYAQELKENTYNLTRMNLVMRGILPDNIVTRNGDTLEDDWPFFDENDPVNSYDPLYVDAVVSNPPYSQAWSPENKENDPRYSRFGLAPKTKADYAFLLHDLYHLKADGIMTIVLPHGVLFRGGEEGKIRQRLIEENHIDAIIGLPANIFFGTGIPTIIMVLKQKRENTDVLIIDASKGFSKVGKNNVLRARDIKKIVDVVVSRSDSEKFSRVVTRDEIRSNDYNLNIPRYVDSSEQTETWDIYSSMFGGVPESELSELHQYWDAFPKLKPSLFESENAAYCRLKTEDVKTAVCTHSDVTSFGDKYRDAFVGLESTLETELLNGMRTLDISKEEEVLSKYIFQCMEGIPLVDKYEAYQLLDDHWKEISGDLETIQTESSEDSSWTEWCKVLPDNIVQENLLADRLGQIKQTKNRLSEIESEYEELFEQLTEEDKELPFVTETKEGFILKDIAKAIKSKDYEGETLQILKKVDALIKEEKNLKKQLKADEAELAVQTDAILLNLEDDQAKELLKAKWIRPLVNEINGLPEVLIDGFVSKLEALCSKYETTYADVEAEIAETESALMELLDELTGNEFDMKAVAELKTLLGGK